MPTPIGHVLAGAIIFRIFRKKNLALFLLLVFFALLPDIDFLFGFIVGDVNRYHHLFTHSVSFVLIAGIAGSAIVYFWRKQGFLFYSAIFCSAGISHLILDILALDKRPPYGCPLLWPFSRKFIISPFYFFSDVERESSAVQFLSSLLSWHNFRTILLEIAILLPLFILIVLWQNNKEKSGKSNYLNCSALLQRKR